MSQAELDTLQRWMDHCREIGALTKTDQSLRLRVLVQMLQIELEKTVRRSADIKAEDA